MILSHFTVDVLIVVHASSAVKPEIVLSLGSKVRIKKKKNFEKIQIIIFFTLLPFHKKYPTMFLFRISWLILELNT